MKLAGPVRRDVLLTGGMVLIFAVLLVIAAARLIAVERDLNSSASEDLVWALGQAQQEMHWLGTALDQGDEAAAQFRFDLAFSRFPLLREGGMGRRIAELDLSETVAAAEAGLVAIEAQRPAPGQAIQVLAPHIEALRAASNAVMVAERDRAGAQRDTYRRSLIEVLVCIAGIFALGVFLVARLLRSVFRLARAEQSLSRETRFLSLLLESSGEGVVAFDRDLRCTHWNQAIGRVFGKPAREVVGGQLLEVFPFGDDHAVTQMLRRTLEGQDQYMSEHLLPGTDRYLEKASFPLRLDGEVVGGIVIVRDVTERYFSQRELARHHARLEVLVEARTAELHRTEAQLRSAIGTAPDGFAAFDAGDGLIVANDKLRALFANQADLFHGGAPLAAILVAAGLSPEALAEARANGDGELTREIPHEDGSWSLLMLRRAPDGTSVIRFADISVYKQAAEQLRNALEHEQSLRQLYRDFVSMVSHQFRTPLAIIDSATQRLVRRHGAAGVEEIEARAAKIRQAIRRLANLIEGTLDASRMDEGEIDFNPQPCDLGQLVREACERQKELSPTRPFQLDLGALPLSISCDGLLIDQVVGNLIANAAKYSEGHTPIMVRAESDAENVTLTVEDSGVGIPADEIDQVFDRFYRARTAARFPGTGLGLHVARAIARMHGGDIVIASREGVGTQVSLRLPRQAILVVAAQ